MNSIQWTGRLACGRKEKEECLKTMDTIISLAQKSRKEGLLSLQTELVKVAPFLLKKGLSFIIDGIEPAVIRETMENYLASGNYNGKELLQRLLIIEGLLAIQAGNSPLIIREKLSALFGEDFAPAIEEYYYLEDETPDNILKDYLASISVNCTANEHSILEEPIRQLDNRSIQRLLRELDYSDLVRGMNGSDGETRNRILINTATRVAAAIIKDIKAINTLDVQDMLAAQKRILDTLSRLRAEGEIK